MRLRFKMLFLGALIGGVGPLIVLLDGAFDNLILYNLFGNNQGEYQGFLVFFFPLSIALMATEGMTVFWASALFAFLTAINLLMYGSAGFVCDLLLEFFHGMGIFEKRSRIFNFSFSAIIFVIMLVLFEFLILYLLYGINIFKPQL